VRIISSKTTSRRRKENKKKYVYGQEVDLYGSPEKGNH